MASDRLELVLSLHHPGNNLARANIAKRTGATFATINSRVNDSSLLPNWWGTLPQLMRFRELNFNRRRIDRFLLPRFISKFGKRGLNTVHFPWKNVFRVSFFFLFFFRLQGRVSVRVAVAAEILLGQGYRRLHRLADEHVFRLWLRVPWKYWTISDYTAHRSVRWFWRDDLEKVGIKHYVGDIGRMYLSSSNFSLLEFIIKREKKRNKIWNIK